MLRKIKKAYRWVFLLAFILSAYGCAPLIVVGAAGGTYAVWKKGRLTETLEYSLNDVHAATVKALNGLDLPLLVNKRDGMESIIESRFSDGKKIRINIKHKAYDSCELTIRVGTFGDETRSFQLLGAISRKL